MSKANTESVPVTKRSLFSWVLTSDKKLQAGLLCVIVVTVFARVLPLELQKKIINEAIAMGKVNLLLTYCGLYLASVLVASGLKFVIVYLQTKIGQKALAAIRKQLYHHILTLPLNYFRKTQAGMVVSSLLTEIAPAGEFVSMAIGVPITNVLTLLAFGGYLFYLNWMLACLSLAIYPIVLFTVPRLQKYTNKANKQRVDVSRDLSSKIAESVTGVHEIHGNGAYDIENAKYDSIVDRLFKIRLMWTLYKQAVKVFNNLFVNLAPFLLFIAGGYLIIQGKFDLGSLVAFLSAQEKLFEPWKELLDFYQVGQDASVRYNRTMEYFDEMPEHEMRADRPPLELQGSIETKNLAFTVSGGIRLLNDVNMELKPGEHLALVGFSGSGKSTLALCIGQLYRYTGGSILVGGEEVSGLTKRDIVRNFGFVSQSPFIFHGTIKENLLYSCVAALEPGVEPVEGENMPTLDDMISVLQQTGIFVDVLRFGLNTILAHENGGELAERIIRVRKNFQADFGKELANNVEFFDEDKYLFHSTVAANILFGSPHDADFQLDNLSNNKYFLEFLDEAQLTNPLLSLGSELARQTVDILGGLPADSVFFEQSPIPAEEFEEYEEIVKHLGKKQIHALEQAEQDKLLDLALHFVPGTHKMVAMPDIMENLILSARSRLREKLAEEKPGAVTPYLMGEYIYTQTILDNILFGKTKTDTPQAQEKINQSIIQLLIEEDLLEAIVEIGMHYDVGTRGDKLSGGQCQKLAIARVFLKAPRILIMDEATSALDNKSQARIQNVLKTKWHGKSTLISVVHRLDIIKDFDKVAVMKAGKIVEFDKYDTLMERKGLLYELVHGKKPAM